MKPFALGCLVVMLTGGEWLAAAEPAHDSAAFFRQRVQPILVKSCFSCHGPQSEVKGGLFLGSRAAILAGGESGPAVDLKAPEKSLLLAAVNYDTYEMPPGDKLPAEQIAVLTQWVTMGVPFPKEAETARPEAGANQRGPQITEESKNFWSFRPIVDPAVPDVRNRAWATNPIDHFILAKLEAAGLEPAPPADKRKLLRRATYDLTGLPPTPEEVDAFLADESSDAWERVIDRLLASPQYGERWGRHWLDLVRFAESNSYERDGTKPYAWRYRDYVIQSFNEDKPYSQFIQEQLAGDEFDVLTPESIVATGYYRLGIWDDEPADPMQALYDDLDDIVQTTSQVFLGLTMNCARCHDHKLDPIPQKDYYRFLAFFNGIRRYGVRSDESVMDASVGPIAINEREAEQAEQRQRLDRELIAANRQIADFERRLLELLTPPEKEDFRAASVRLDIARKYAGNGLSAAQVEEYAAKLALRRELEELRPAALPQTLVVKEVGPTPRPTYVLVRGNANVRGDQVEPGFPTVLSPPEPEISPSPWGRSSGRRTALARWIASEQNPLTARVMANRLWQHHFGCGIVRSSNNFGAAGDPPTHPELLDWLAVRLMKGGWKLKPLHKLIMLSSAYQMSSQAHAVGLSRDPANHLFWRFDMRRLSAEEIRDSILAANGSLNLKMGGPSIYPLIPQEVLAGQSRPGHGWGTSSEAERARRSVYIFTKRSLLEPMLADFDFADVDSTCPVRFATTQPTQALALLNSDFVQQQAAIFADSLRTHAGEDRSAQVSLGLTRALRRTPTATEVERGVRFLTSLSEDGISDADALKYFCLMCYNLNEFLYLD